jgi:hypothetical protein
VGPLISGLISLLMPVAADSVKQWVSYKLGGPKATNVAEQIQLDQSEVARLQAVAALDTPGGTPSQWVIDLRASSRYLAAFIVIIGGGTAIFIPEVPTEIKLVCAEAVSIVFGFLFGTRLVAARSR